MDSNDSEASNTTKNRDTSGTVEQVLPNALFSVRTAEGRLVLAALETEARRPIVRIIPGDRVAIRITTHDPNRGRITAKL